MSRVDTSTSTTTGDREAALASWLTPDLVADTIATWQPYYAEELTEREAVAILQSVGRLVDVLEYSS